MYSQEINESASKECGTITLDLLLRAGVLGKQDDGRWGLTEDYALRRIYIVSDTKTVENMVEFVRDMQDRQITYSHASIQAEIFISALRPILAVFPIPIPIWFPSVSKWIYH